MTHRWTYLGSSCVEGVFVDKWELQITLDKPLDLGDQIIIGQSFNILGKYIPSAPKNLRIPPIPDDQIFDWFNRWAYRYSKDSVRMGMCSPEFVGEFAYHMGGSD